jgi:hypothetical protein
VPEFHKFHNAQRTKLKPHDPMRKLLSDRKPVQSSGARTSLDARRRGSDDARVGTPPVNRARDEVQVGAPSVIERKGDQTTAPTDASADVVRITPPTVVESQGDKTIGTAPADASADVVQITPPTVVERKGDQTVGTAPADASADVVRITPPTVVEKGEQTIGMAPADVSADVVQVKPPPVVEHNGASITRSLELAFSLVMIMVIVALGFITLLFHHRYAERILAFAAMRRSEARADCVRRVNFACPPQIEADPNSVSSLEASVKKVLGTIKEAEAEMASPRRLRTRL